MQGLGKYKATRECSDTAENVAHMVADGVPVLKLSLSFQFITSSFQPELVQAADKHWLVTHSGMSRMVVGTLEDQLDIVRKNQQTAAEQQALQ